MATEQELELRRLARRIADRLFMNGAGEKAQRLVLTVDTPSPHTLGGWGKGPAIDQIYDVLLKERAK